MYITSIDLFYTLMKCIKCLGVPFLEPDFSLLSPHVPTHGYFVSLDLDRFRVRGRWMGKKQHPPTSTTKINHEVIMIFLPFFPPNDYLPSLKKKKFPLSIGLML